jgi:hypothetical protein
VPALPAWGDRRTKRLEKTIGAHAAAVPDAGEADPGALAGSALSGHRAEQAALEKGRADKAQAQADKRESARLKQLRHPPALKPPDQAADGFKRRRAADESAHAKLVERDQLEAAGYGALRARGYGLRNQLAAASEFVRREVKRASESVEQIVTAAPHARLAETTKALDAADKAIQSALAAESAFASVREKATRIMGQINGAGPAFKDRIAAKSREVAERYSTGSPVAAGKPQQQAHVELNSAEQDVAARAKDWELAGRSRGKLAALKLRRTAIGRPSPTACATVRPPAIPTGLYAS